MLQSSQELEPPGKSERFAPKEAGLGDWKQLEGKPVCATQGAFQNELVDQVYGAKVMPFASNDLALQALRAGRCIAWVCDSAFISALLGSDEWTGSQMPLQTLDAVPWVVAVSKEELDNVWGRFMSAMVYWRHTSGRLIELEIKWGIQSTEYLHRMQRKFE